MTIKDRFLPKKGSNWRSIAVLMLGAFLGLGLFVAKEAEVVSYLSDDPQACINCHVMTSVYKSWSNSSHHKVASCNDCHVPQDNVAKKYYFKAKDGLYHASVFTARNEPQVIRIKEDSEAVVQQNCIRCHVGQVTDSKLTAYLDDHIENRTTRKCWSCHQNVPHGDVHGSSSITYHIAPKPTDELDKKTKIPEWLKEAVKEK
ncbi:cytochrome c nitrite reductase small subunit [Spongiivirga sp. MCCC 1A20706]|uniref:cytochrome c nitrite reductase small subunit n=1 Tax=Spongiivirga sp. MCCC 1A20706 TaxID=3160963 RepID=UPI0039778439